uniref:DALR anticodon binding domain containing 3 n=1 Tax=Sphenodon punctatus TaxID=8508 RepID=A0A8D0GH52_SPHPU
VPSPTSVHAPRGLGSVPLALGIRLGIGENESGSPCAGVGARGGRGTSPPAPQPRALCRLLHAVPARGVAALCSHGDAASSGVPQDIVERLVSLKCPGVPPVQSCQQGQAGLTVQLERAAVFEQVLSTIPTYTKPSCSACGQSILLNCVSLRSRRLSLSHLRAILVADHLAGLLRAGGAEVYQVPAVAEEGIQAFLHQLRVEWPSQAASCPEDVVALKQALGQCPHATAAGAGPEGLFKVSLKGFLQEQQGPEGYDPNLDVFLVTEETLGLVAELQSTVLRCTGAAPGGCCSVVHVVSCEEEFWQQKVDLLWRMLDPQAHAALQKHLVCGSVKVPDSPSPLDASQYFQIRRSQLHAASVLKYGDLAQDSWSEMVDILTCAVVRFEMLSAAHRNQIHLALEDTGISTKGTRSGAFVMYNCARLATLFQSYRRAVERGRMAPAFQQHPALPRGAEPGSAAPLLRQGDQGHSQHRGSLQVPGPPEHGFQLLLQSCAHPGGAAAPLVQPDVCPAAADECGARCAPQCPGHTPPAPAQPDLRGDPASAGVGDGQAVALVPGVVGGSMEGLP